jgi:multiple sugar transport system permease protein
MRATQDRTRLTYRPIGSTEFRGPVPILLLTLLVLVLLLLNVLPLFWGLLTSLKNTADLFRFPPSLVDFTPTLENYERVVQAGYLSNIWVTFGYSVLTVLIVIVVGLPAAHAFDRCDFRFKRHLFMIIIACIPLSMGAAALLIPTYIYFARLGITNTWFVLPLIYSAYQLPMAIWIFKGSIESIPSELDEAAAIDGLGHFGTLWHIILPLMRPALATVAILGFVGVWNEFIAGSVMVDAPALKPIQPAVYSFIGFYGREWGPLTASAILAVLPILVIFVIFRRQFVTGLTNGAVKG